MVKILLNLISNVIVLYKEVYNIVETICCLGLSFVYMYVFCIFTMYIKQNWFYHCE